LVSQVPAVCPCARPWWHNVHPRLCSQSSRDIDTSKVVVIGPSQGDITSVALGERNLHGVLGIVNFAGGSRNERCGGWQNELVDAFKVYGADDFLLWRQRWLLGGTVRSPSVSSRPTTQAIPIRLTSMKVCLHNLNLVRYRWRQASGNG